MTQTKHTRAERKALRSKKRKSGPSAVRRREARHAVIETLECGCQKTKYEMIECPAHTPEAMRARREAGEAP